VQEARGESIKKQEEEREGGGLREAETNVSRLHDSKKKKHNQPNKKNLLKVT